MKVFVTTLRLHVYDMAGNDMTLRRDFVGNPNTATATAWMREVIDAIDKPIRRARIDNHAGSVMRWADDDTLIAHNERYGFTHEGTGGMLRWRKNGQEWQASRDATFHEMMYDSQRDDTIDLAPGLLVLADMLDAAYDNGIGVQAIEDENVGQPDAWFVEMFGPLPKGKSFTVIVGKHAMHVATGSEESVRSAIAFLRTVAEYEGANLSPQVSAWEMG